MTLEEYNDYCSSLLATSHVVQWGGAHVWKVGGKVFAIGGWNKTGEVLGVTIKVARMDYEALVDQPGIRPAPYLASRGMTWVQHHELPGLSDGLLLVHIEESHRIVGGGLSKKKQRELGLL